MRITNQMMVNSTMANIQVNKKQVNTLETQLSTQKKINKPSEDPVIAIRALRLRSSLEQVTQYLNKNIPDADSWLKTTEGAVDEAVSVITDLYAYCEQGATDSYSPSERSTLAESLNKLRDAYYAEGDVEYAGRYLFSGYMTDTPLTYQSDETAAKADFTITQEFTRENIELKTVYTNAYSNDDILNLNVKTDAATGNVITPNVADVHRVRIGYTKVSDAGTFEIKLNDGTKIAAAAVNDSNYQPGDDEAAFNAATGEILLGENVYKQLYASDGFSFTYNNPDNAGVVYTKKTEDIEYNINFSQKLKVNTEANEVFNMYLGRDIDDLITSVNNVIDIEAQLEKVEGMLKQDIYSDKDSQSKLNSIKEGLTKQNELAKEEMKNRFEYCVGTMQGYQEQASLAKADAGNRMTRLNLTKSRLTEQKTNFTNLKSENEDIDLEEVVVGYSAAQLVYNASLTAASKVIQQTLLDFL